MAASSRSEKDSAASKTTSRRIKIAGKIRAVRVPDDLWEEAQRIAEERGETLSTVIRKALQEYVDNAEKQ
jgi:predicted DNA-binding ribbon-helix-helix protein